MPTAFMTDIPWIPKHQRTLATNMNTTIPGKVFNPNTSGAKIALIAAWISIPNTAFVKNNTVIIIAPGTIAANDWDTAGGTVSGN